MDFQDKKSYNTSDTFLNSWKNYCDNGDYPFLIYQNAKSIIKFSFIKSFLDSLHLSQRIDIKEEISGHTGCVIELLEQKEQMIIG